MFEDFMVPYSVEFDTDHQFKRPIQPVAPNSIADDNQQAYYNITVDPYNPGASTYGFGQTDILTADEYETIVSYYSNVEEYKEHVNNDEFGNELAGIAGLSEPLMNLHVVLKKKVNMTSLVV